MRLALAVSLAAALATPASGQINAERMRRSLEADGVHAAVNADLALARGNTDYVRAGVGGRADWKRGRDLVFLVGEVEFSSADDEVFVDEGHAHLRYNHDLSRVLVLEAFGQLQRNSQQLLVTRALGGAGARFRLLDTGAVGVAVGTTPMLEYERLAPEADEPEATVGRWSNYLAVRTTLSGTASLSGVVYAQPRITDIEDVRYLAQATLEAAVTRWLRLRVRADLRHDSQPPAGVETTDVSVSNGLVFLFPAPAR